MPAGHMPPSYSIRVRDREFWNTWVNRGHISHERRCKRWGKWKTWRVASNEPQALAFLEEMRKRHPLSDVGVFYGGKRVEDRLSPHPKVTDRCASHPSDGTHECLVGEMRCAYCGSPCNGCGKFLTAKHMHEAAEGESWRCEECRGF